MPGRSDDVVTWLQAMDVFVLPAYAKEGVPQALMQAMACGLPVISTPVGAIPEVIEEGWDGLFVPPQDSVALSQEIRRLIEDDDLRAELAAQARLKAEGRFAVDRMLDRMNGVFLGVLDKPLSAAA